MLLASARISVVFMDWDYKRPRGVCFGVEVPRSRQQATHPIDRTEEAVKVRSSLVLSLLLALTVAVITPAVAAAPEGQLTIAVHVSLAPTWFDPAETPGSSRRS
jgi:hypothetical protein